MDKSLIASTYNDFEASMDAAIEAKGDLSATLDVLIQELDTDRETMATVIAGYLCTYRGAKALALDPIKGTDEFAIKQKAVLNTIQYARTTANKLLNEGHTKDAPSLVLTKFTNRPQVKDGKLTEDYTMGMEWRVAKPTPVELEEELVGEETVAVDLPEASLDDMMAAVVEKYGLNVVAEWVINADEKVA